MMKLAPEWVRTSDPVIRSPARYRWTTAPAWVDEEDDEVGLKEKTEDTRYIQTDYIKISTRSTGSVDKGLVNLIPIYCYHWYCGLLGKSTGASSLRVPSAGAKCPSRAAYNWVLNCGSPRPKEEVFKVLNLNGWAAFCII